MKEREREEYGFFSWIGCCLLASFLGFYSTVSLLGVQRGIDTQGWKIAVEERKQAVRNSNCEFE